MTIAPNTLLLIQAAILVAGPWAAWRYGGLRRVVPLAVLQIVAGVVLGPSVLGAIAPALQQTLFPPAAAPRIAAVAQIAVVLYSFCTGMHLDERAMRIDRRVAAWSAGAFVVPALAGLAMAPLIARWLPAMLPPDGATVAFHAACALLMTVTALPVLAALLKELGLLRTPFGQEALGLAALNDAAMWIGVAALLIATAPAGSWLADGSAIALLPLYALGLVAARALLRRAGTGDAAQIGAAAFAFASAAAGEYCGLGYVVGAFAAGIIVPPDLRVALLARIEWPALYLLMPFFFMATGLRIDEPLLSWSLAGIVALLAGVATLSKMVATALTAPFIGETRRYGAALGAAVQTKGLMEVLVATILVDRGVVGPAMFAPLILMALVCTVVTAPLLRALGLPPRQGAGDAAAMAA